MLNYLIKITDVNKRGVIGEMVFNPDQWKTGLNMNPATANGFGIY